MKWWLRALCLVGALRVLAFCAAYPVFDYRDEGLHLDVVTTFARVGLPGPGEDGYKVETARIGAAYGVALLAPPFEPIYHSVPEPRRTETIEAEARRIATYRNPETFAPPLYYAVAAVWYRVGQLFIGDEILLAYWLRCLSAPLYGLAMWLACRVCAEFHRERPHLAIAAALILAFLPQDILYTINSDVFSPVVIALATYLLLRWMNAPTPSPRLAAGAGLAAAAALLGKYSNVAAPAAVLMAIVLARRKRSVAEVATLLACAALPVVAWMIRCHLIFGDWTALQDKYAQIGWKEVTLAESLRHPIFGPVGIVEFLRQLCVTFWRGEIVYDGFVQRAVLVDGFYMAVTAIGVVGTAGWLLRPAPASRPERRYAALYVVMIASQVVFLGLISTRFDFGNYFYPSRGSPYFAMGRLMTGVLVPFAILLAGSLDELCQFAGPRRGRLATLTAAAVIAAVCLASELYLCCVAPSRNLFASPWNLYHRAGIELRSPASVGPRSGDSGPRPTSRPYP